MASAPIRCERLDLVCMGPAFLRASLAGERAVAEAALGASLPQEWPDVPSVLALRLAQLQAEPELEPWLLRAMVLRGERRVVGHLGFHSGPDPLYLRGLAPGGVELGNTVFEADRRRGYAREACSGLMRWAQRVHGVRRFVVSVSPSNEASLGLIASLGFRRIGSHIDEQDGPEDIFECSL